MDAVIESLDLIQLDACTILLLRHERSSYYMHHFKVSCNFRTYRSLEGLKISAAELIFENAQKKSQRIRISRRVGLF